MVVTRNRSKANGSTTQTNKPLPKWPRKAKDAKGRFISYEAQKKSEKKCAKDQEQKEEQVIEFILSGKRVIQMPNLVTDLCCKLPCTKRLVRRRHGYIGIYGPIVAEEYFGLASTMSIACPRCSVISQIDIFVSHVDAKTNTDRYLVNDDIVQALCDKKFGPYHLNVYCDNLKIPPPMPYLMQEYPQELAGVRGVVYESLKEHVKLCDKTNVENRAELLLSNKQTKEIEKVLLKYLVWGLYK